MSMTNSLADAVAEVARLEKLATKAPWEWHTSNSWRRLKCDASGVVENVIEPYVVGHDNHPDLMVNECDMDFIAASRNLDWPAIVDALRANEWVSVKERLPERNKLVLWAVRDSPTPVTGKLRSDGVRVSEWELQVDPDPIEAFTHWLPLPAPPSAAAASAAAGEPKK